jgi:plasmid maintenance system antidote protein VapI
MRMYNPPHPGEVLRELCLEPMSLSVTQAAEALGVSVGCFRWTIWN